MYWLWACISPHVRQFLFLGITFEKGKLCYILTNYTVRPRQQHILNNIRFYSFWLEKWQRVLHYGLFLALFFDKLTSLSSPFILFELFSLESVYETQFSLWKFIAMETINSWQVKTSERVFMLCRIMCNAHNIQCKAPHVSTVEVQFGYRRNWLAASNSF